jgi:hypothetical protein
MISINEYPTSISSQSYKLTEKFAKCHQLLFEFIKIKFLNNQKMQKLAIFFFVVLMIIGMALAAPEPQEPQGMGGGEKSFGTIETENEIEVLFR